MLVPGVPLTHFVSLAPSASWACLLCRNSWTQLPCVCLGFPILALGILGPITVPLESQPEGLSGSGTFGAKLQWLLKAVDALGECGLSPEEGRGRRQRPLPPDL